MIFCPECGTKNKDDAKFCEKCGASIERIDKYKKKIEKTSGSNKSKILIAIIIAAVVAVGIGGYYAYQNHRMSQMDDNMLQASQLNSEANKQLEQLSSISSSNPTDYTSQMQILSSTINIEKQILNYHQEAYQYADGPYKDLISLAINADNLKLDSLDSTNRILISAQSNDINSVNTYKSKLNGTINQLNGLQNDYNSLKSNDPNLEEHVKNNWDLPAINILKINVNLIMK